MATLKSLLAPVTVDTNLGFRNSDKPDAKGVTWSNAWVNTIAGDLLCIGATVATLEALKANPKLDTLMLTAQTDHISKPSATSAGGKAYKMCHLAIAKVDYSFSVD